MGDKESLESSIAQHHGEKQNPFAAASVSGKLQPQLPKYNEHPVGGSSNDRSGSQLNSNSGYYQNVTQKGKLILPTAIWILIVVGGLCFLSLLSSLNKTINTLDALIEIEQANSKVSGAAANEHDKQQAPVNSHRRGHSHHHVRHSGPQAAAQTGPAAERLEWMSPFGEEQQVRELKLMSSWLSMPPWTSLEPVSRTKRPRQRPESVSIDSLFGPFSSDSSPLESSGSIIIASGQPGAGPTGLSPIDSILSQLFGDGSPLSGSKHQAAESHEEKSEKSQSMITANIDKLNININSKDEEEESRRHSDRVPMPPAMPPMDHRHHNAMMRNPEVDDVKTLDRIMELMMNNPAAGQQQQPVDLPAGGFLIPLGMPHPSADSPMDHMPPVLRHPKHHHHHHHQLQQPQPQPLSNGEQLPLDQDVILQQNEDGSVIAFPIELSGNELSMGPVSAEPSDNKRPASPYEFNSNHHHHNHQLDLSSPKENGLEQDLKTLAQSLFQVKQEDQRKPDAADNKNTADFDSIILINGEPLISDKKQSLSFNEEPAPKVNQEKPQEPEKKEKQNDMKNLFTMFFGPQPNSKFFLDPVGPVDKKVETLKMDNNPAEMPKAVEVQKEESNKKVEDVILSTEMPMIPMSSLLQINPEETKIQEAAAPAPQPEDQSNIKDPKDIASLVDGLFTNMFSMPQFGSEQAPMKVEAQMGGNRQEKPIIKSSTTETTTTITSSTTETSPIETTTNIPSSGKMPTVKNKDLVFKAEDPKVVAETTTTTTTTTAVTPAEVSTTTTTAATPVEVLTTQIPITTTTSASTTAKPDKLSISISKNEKIPSNAQVVEFKKDHKNSNILVVQPTTEASQNSTTRETQVLTVPLESTVITLGRVADPTPLMNKAILAELDKLAPSTTTASTTVESNTLTTVEPAPQTKDSTIVSGQVATEPTKTFLEKADDFIERNFQSFKRFLS